VEYAVEFIIDAYGAYRSQVVSDQLFDDPVDDVVRKSCALVAVPKLALR
jgi:hypothetical protein